MIQKLTIFAPINPTNIFQTLQNLLDIYALCNCAYQCLHHKSFKTKNNKDKTRLSFLLFQIRFDVPVVQNLTD